MLASLTKHSQEQLNTAKTIKSGSQGRGRTTYASGQHRPIRIRLGKFILADRLIQCECHVLLLPFVYASISKSFKMSNDSFLEVSHVESHIYLYIHQKAIWRQQNMTVEEWNCCATLAQYLAKQPITTQPVNRTHKTIKPQNHSYPHHG